MSITSDVQLMADQHLDALDKVTQISCLSNNRSDFDIETAYAISDIISDIRSARGEEIIGIKIGFTNKSLWDEYNVHIPIFAPKYTSTQLETGKPVDLSNYVEPKIEPEIFFTIASIPNSQMTDLNLWLVIPTTDMELRLFSLFFQTGSLPHRIRSQPLPYTGLT